MSEGLYGQKAPGLNSLPPVDRPAAGFYFSESPSDTDSGKGRQGTMPRRPLLRFPAVFPCPAACGIPRYVACLLFPASSFPVSFGMHGAKICPRAQTSRRPFPCLFSSRAGRVATRPGTLPLSTRWARAFPCNHPAAPAEGFRVPLFRPPFPSVCPMPLADPEIQGPLRQSQNLTALVTSPFFTALSPASSFTKIIF